MKLMLHFVRKNPDKTGMAINHINYFSKESWGSSKKLERMCVLQTDEKSNAMKDRISAKKVYLFWF